MTAFHRLSNELLWTIVENVKGLAWKGNLRLVHPHFANLQALNAIFFERVGLTIHNTYDSFRDELDDAKFATVGPFVRTVVMRPSIFFWTVTMDDFEAFVAGNEEHSPSFDDDAIRDSYSSHYKLHAERARKVFMDHRCETEAILSETFQRLPQLRGLVISRQKAGRDFDFDSIYDALCGQTPDEPTPCGIVLAKTLSCRFEDQGARHKLAGESGDMLFELVIRALAKANVQPHRLELVHDSTTPGWLLSFKDPSWDKLDLTRLQHLDFSPYASAGISRRRKKDENYALAHETGAAINKILRECADSLQTLIMGDYNPGIWPTPDTPALPALTYLEQAHGYPVGIPLRELAALLRRCPKIAHLGLTGNLYGGYNYKALFDAIRDHPTKMRIKINQVPAGHWWELSFEHHTSQQVHVKPGSHREDYPDDSIAAYLTGTCGWNRALRDWFMDDNDWSADEYDDSEDDRDHEDA